MGFSFKRLKKAISKPFVDTAAKAREEAERAAAKVREEAERAANEARAAAERAKADVQKQYNNARTAVNTIKNYNIGPAYQTALASTKSAMAKANVSAAAMDDIEAGSKLAIRGLEQGAYKIAEGGELIGEWIEANYCQIGVSIALGSIFAALLYRPEPASQATTTAATAPLSATAVMYLAAKETVGAVALGVACDLTAEAFVELIWMAPDVKKAIGSANKELLIDAIAFTLSKSIDAAAGAMIIPQSCAAVVAGVVTTLTAQLACERTLPNGAREWGSAGASGI
jgi:hypothetical protein